MLINLIAQEPEADDEDVDSYGAPTEPPPSPPRYPPISFNTIDLDLGGLDQGEDEDALPPSSYEAPSVPESFSYNSPTKSSFPVSTSSSSSSYNSPPPSSSYSFYDFDSGSGEEVRDEGSDEEAEDSDGPLGFEIYEITPSTAIYSSPSSSSCISSSE